jgi:hypothetical protein
MNVEIGTKAPIFLIWEYLFKIFGILSLQGRGQMCRAEGDKKQTEVLFPLVLGDRRKSLLLPNLNWTGEFAVYIFPTMKVKI